MKAIVPAAKHASQRRLVAALDPQWLAQFDALRPEYVRDMLGGIVNFEIPVARLEARWKLSQNRGRDEQERIAAALENAQLFAEMQSAREHLEHQCFDRCRDRAAEASQRLGHRPCEAANE